MYRVYVGNLDSEVTEAILSDVLRQRSVASTAIVVKRGYAFVDCPDAVAFDYAIQQLNGRPTAKLDHGSGPSVGFRSGRGGGRSCGSVWWIITASYANKI